MTNNLTTIRIYIEFNIPDVKDKLAIASDVLNTKEIEQLIYNDYKDAYNLIVKRYKIK